MRKVGGKWVGSGIKSFPWHCHCKVGEQSSKLTDVALGRLLLIDVLYKLHKKSLQLTYLPSIVHKPFLKVLKMNLTLLLHKPYALKWSFYFCSLRRLRQDAWVKDLLLHARQLNAASVSLIREVKCQKPHLLMLKYALLLLSFW